MESSAEQELTRPGEMSDFMKRAFSFADLSRYSRKQRLAIRVADVLFYLLIKLIGSSMRWQVEGQENWDSASANGHYPILACWHNRLFLGIWFFQQRRIVAMTSQSFDGEYIARFLQRFGFGAARGSSTRGSTGALVQMVRLMRSGCPVAFTIDGPKGPRYVAKMGAVLLAKKTGHPILPFNVTARRFWQASSWDRFQVPCPFTRARVDIAAPIYVPGDADDEALATKRSELQVALDDLNRRSEEWRTGA
jgi:lysophospholipid acyltransferase (LPLAT)-like uncharacterized protein